jgi:VWFA-related protein
LLPPETAAQQTVARADHDLPSSTSVVSVAAIVRDRKGRFVRDLERKDFTVAESGRQKAILDFRKESDGPVKLALLFDISGSMRVASRAVDAQQAARHLLSALRPTDQAALFSFDTRLQRVRGFTSDVDSLITAIGTVEPPYGQTSLYDAVAETARAVAATADDQRGGPSLAQRRAVVVLTDGVDTRSRLTAAEVTSIASEIDVPVYVLAVMSAVDDPREDDRDDEAAALRNLAHWTGGDLFISTAPAHASIASRRIIDELRHQYVLAFEASAQPGWHPLEVRARNRDLVVRARAGYTAGGAAGP